MAFEKEMPRWEKKGTEPPDSKKITGWDAGDKPPADYFNWQWNGAYEAVKELQEKAAEKAWVEEQLSHVDLSAENVTLDSPDFVSTNVKDGMEELFTSVSSGKQQLETAITDKGGTVSKQQPVPTFGELDAGIRSIPQAKGNATRADVLASKTFSSEVAGIEQAGTMPNRGAVSQTITTQNGQYTIPQGYHSGTGKVTASFANLTPANVRQGINIGGVVGNLKPSINTIYYDSGTQYIPFMTGYTSGEGIVNFRPSQIEIGSDKQSILTVVSTNSYDFTDVEYIIFELAANAGVGGSKSFRIGLSTDRDNQGSFITVGSIQNNLDASLDRRGLVVNCRGVTGLAYIKISLTVTASFADLIIYRIMGISKNN